MNLGSIQNTVYQDENFKYWCEKWKERLYRYNISNDKSIKLMKEANPLVIPRNHKVEDVLESAENNDIDPIKKFLEILKKPYTEQTDISSYQYPSNTEKKYQTFCGT
tara:strand:- start:205 stop:525 length:321 start_codon:yes stop_codon:yes gene_type:complete